MTEQPDYYAILEIEPAASRRQIEEAYESLAKRYQPDADQPPTEPEKMRLVDEAFDILDDPERRAGYHRVRGLPEPGVEAPARPVDVKTIGALVLIVAGAAALVAGIVLSVLVILDDEPGWIYLEDGLAFKDLAVGSGEYPPPGSRVTVHYTGKLEDGTVFDSSIGGEPFQFNVGRGDVIQGWDEAIPSMRVGGRRELIIPPHLAYGDSGAGALIPPNATLIFEVQLLSFEE